MPEITPFEFPASGKVGHLDEPHIAILMCTYNGEPYLAEQLDSICSQQHGNWSVWVSHDGGDDGTISILSAYQEKIGSDRFHILYGPQKGFAANFMSLITRPEIEADYYAFCDQDDIWLPGKLSSALTMLQAFPETDPALYGARTTLVDEQGGELGESPLFERPPSFRNALVQSLAGGNTMLFNRAARDVLLKAGVLDVVCHDWWAYIIISGAGGNVVYDPEPKMLYRQHQGNIIGANAFWQGRLQRLFLLLRNRFREWNSLNLAALRQCDYLLTAENRDILDLFEETRDAGLCSRLNALFRSGVYRQTWPANVALIVAVMLKKM